MLSSWNVPFEGIDVEAKPDRMADLARFGIPRVPATIAGDRFVHGWNPKALAELVGVNYAGAARLTPAELAKRLDLILAATQRVLRQVPAEHLEMKAPDRDRTVRQLGFHVFRLSLAFREAREQGYFRQDWLEDDPPPAMKTSEDIVRYGDDVRKRLAEFVARPGWCDGDVTTYYGTHPAHDLMERTTWHAAQHLRQLYWFLERLGVAPEARLTDDRELAGLPFPKAVWS